MVLETDKINRFDFSSVSIKETNKQKSVLVGQ